MDRIRFNTRDIGHLIADTLIFGAVTYPGIALGYSVFNNTPVIESFKNSSTITLTAGLVIGRLFYSSVIKPYLRR